MYRQLLVITILFSIFAGNVWSAEKKVAPFTQKDCATLLLKQLGWDSGLPKEPTDRDYLVVLGGKRTFRYEAENAYNAKTDNVSVSEFEIYGPFSGKGWVMGVSTTTKTHFTLMLPIGGEYTIKSKLKGARFEWKIGEKSFVVGSPNKKMNEVTVGKMNLPAGIVQMTITIPPEGGIDSLTISGSDYPPVQPFIGWRFKEELTAGKLAEIIASANNLLPKLPNDPNTPPLFFPALDLVKGEPAMNPVDTAYLGAFNAKKWMRAPYSGSNAEMSLQVDKLGLYDVTINLLAEEVNGELNGIKFSLPGKPYLSKVSLGQHRLDAGTSKLTLKIPPLGGIDAIYLTKKDISSEAFMKLVGMTGSPDRLVTEKEAIELIKTVSPRNSVKK